MHRPVSARVRSSGSSLSILYVAPTSGTALQRRRALEQLGHDVVPIEDGAPHGWRFQIHRIGFRLRRPPDLMGTNRAVLAASTARRWDVLWVDKSLTMRPATLAEFRRRCPSAALVSYCPDDSRIVRGESLRYARAIPEYDLHVTTKTYNVEELTAWGARDVFFVDNAYCPEVHRPIRLTDSERDRFACGVGFIGYFEEDRAEKMLALAEAGVRVVIRGLAWHRKQMRHPNLEIVDEYLGDEDYPKAVNATDVNLGFLRKRARDLQTTRSIEIPACGRFLLAERTDEHEALFTEGTEAEYFGDIDELVEKTRYYESHPSEREQIARAGLERCRRDGYDNASRLRRVLDHLRATERIDR